MATIFTFPGQGSQSIGMMRELSGISPIIESTFDEASAVLGYDLWKLCQEGPESRLNSTECTQPAMLAAGVATYRLWRERGGARPDAVAGHSLGEFSAAVVAKSLHFKDAISLVQFRGRVMQSALPAGEGAMAAILGIEDTDVERACREASQGEVVEPANFNAPGQVVIAGHVNAVERAIAACKHLGAKRAVILPISAPCHSSLMQGAADELGQRLEQIEVNAPEGVRFFGVDMRSHDTAQAVRAALVKQLATAVYWAALVRTLVALGYTRFIECGPGKVLTSLNRRIERSRDVHMLSLDGAQGFDAVLEAAA